MMIAPPPEPGVTADLLVRVLRERGSAELTDLSEALYVVDLVAGLTGLVLLVALMVGSWGPF